MSHERPMHLIGNFFSFIYLFIYLFIFDHMFRRLHCCTSPNCDGHPNTRNFAFRKAQAVRRRAGFEVSSVGALQRTWAELNKSFACLPTYPSTHPSIHPSMGSLVSKHRCLSLWVVQDMRSGQQWSSRPVTARPWRKHPPRIGSGQNFLAPIFVQSLGVRL